MENKKACEKVLWAIKSLLAAYLVTGIGLLILAFLLYKMHLGRQQIVLGVNTIYVLSSFVGGLIIGKLTGQRKWLWGLMMGVGYYLLLVGVSFLVYHHITADVKSLLTILVLCLCSSTIGGMFAR